MSIELALIQVKVQIFYFLSQVLLHYFYICAYQLLNNKMSTSAIDGLFNINVSSKVTGTAMITMSHQITKVSVIASLSIVKSTCYTNSKGGTEVTPRE